uniref:Insulinase family protein n=1 Tax=Eiseniibacteriota bacterium TaxID=2212470 RepID=A0A832MKK5_UNCEI
MRARTSTAASAALALAVALAASAAAAPPDRTRPPALGAPPALTLPRVQTRTLPNGLELGVVEMHETPVVHVTLIVRAGSVCDPADLPGLATFTANMLDEGAGGRGALAVSDAFEFLGAQFSASASRENATLTLHVPKRQFAAAFDLMADVVLRPDFPDSEIVRQRELRKNQLLQLRDQPTAISPIAFNAVVFGASHPFGRPGGGTDASTEALTRARVVEFWRRWYRPGHARMLVVGDVTPSEAAALVRKRFGAWARGAVAAPEVPAAPAPGPRAIHLVDKPGAAQSVVRIGHAGVARNHPDHYPLLVMNTILGGSFTSRLNTNLRETHGYTYGARSSWDWGRWAGPFAAFASVQTAKTDSALIEFMKELRRIRDEGVPAAELDKAKSYIALGLPGSFETTSDVASQFAALWSNDLPLDTYDQYLPKIMAVTAADVQRVARAHIDPDRLAIVIVGDRKEIEPGLARLGEGPIVHRDLWGAEARP